MDATRTLLIANRGEIAVRIIRSARAKGMKTIAVRSADEEALGAAAGLHVQLADEVVTLPGRGASAYLDAPEVVRAARSSGAGLVHPGYGFLAESAQLALLCAEAGLTWVGPSADALTLFGDKRATQDRAESLGIPIPAATGLLTTAEDDGETALAAASQLLAAHPDGIAVKAVAGGGGRGIRLVHDPADLPAALTSCAAEARAGFGDDRVFAEALVVGARHIEVQVLGTPEGVHVLGDRDCSIQRRRQKLVEIAPAPGLSDEMRARLHADAARLTGSAEYASLATVEFLVTHDDYVLLEVNPRIQVEHTVTEAVTGLDLVACQLDVATGEVPEALAGRAPEAPAHTETEAVRDSPTTSADLLAPRGTAVQLRVTAETVMETGEPAPSVGTATAVRWPTGPGVRVDTWVESGSTVSGAFDSLLGKIIVHGPTLEAALSAGNQALREVRIAGLDTNTGLLRAIGEVLDPGEETTTSYDAQAKRIIDRAREIDAAARAADTAAGADGPGGHDAEGQGAGGEADTVGDQDLGDGEELLRAPLAGTVVGTGDDPREYVLLEAMKMHHPVKGPAAGHVRHLVAVGDYVSAGTPLAVLGAVDDSHAEVAQEAEPHPGVAEVQERHAAVLDEAREDQLTKIRERGRRTARENIADLVDPGSFVEYGPLVIAAQTQRRSVEDLIRRTSGDGLLGGTATVDGREVVVISYDYSVLAGTQGTRNHAKTDRLIQVAEQREVPLILFAEGGGGRPGDTDRAPTIGLGVPTFGALAKLRGRVPLISVVSGRTFAGNAALAGVCDLIIATPEVNLGMGGPAMIEGGGLGRHRPEDIGPAPVHLANGVIDILADDEADAVEHVKEALSALTRTRRASADAERAFVSATNGSAGGTTGGTPSGAVDEDLAEASRTVVPADRLRAFSMRAAIEAVVDPGSLTEVRRDFGKGAVTGFGRVDGHPFAFIANDNHHLGGAIDVDAARTMTQHLTLAQDHGLPVVSFVDTPGFIVGPESEYEPGVRAFGDLFVAGASLTVPIGAVVIRKGYGLGAMAMMAGGTRATQFTVAWPSGEMGPMGLEGAVRLGYAKELAAIEDPDARNARESALIDELYEQGKAMSTAMLFDIDDVIDPALTRTWIRTLL
ncbi:acetyl-CoA carboxylase family protein [Brevibacterium yomogidense]|uniref:acetyl-CoA carboxylase family protein n=1 Tax=Brevibacterium yomogidense TaxID=946573 RepID=UPI0018DEFF39|nr:carboxyl transferase domain-containing protein [Brevibacterium yomogidense]